MILRKRAAYVAMCLVIGGCNAAPETMKSDASALEPTLKIAVPTGAGCYKSNPGRDRILRSHLLALQEGTVTPEGAVAAIKQSVVDGGFPFNQVPAAESAAAYALSGGDLAAWEQAYEAYAEPGETGRTSFLSSLCWVS